MKGGRRLTKRQRGSRSFQSIPQAPRTSGHRAPRHGRGGPLPSSRIQRPTRSKGSRWTPGEGSATNGTNGGTSTGSSCRVQRKSPWTASHITSTSGSQSTSRGGQPIAWHAQVIRPSCSSKCKLESTSVKTISNALRTTSEGRRSIPAYRTTSRSPIAPQTWMPALPRPNRRWPTGAEVSWLFGLLRDASGSGVREGAQGTWTPSQSTSVGIRTEYVMLESGRQAPPRLQIRFRAGRAARSEGSHNVKRRIPNAHTPPL